jgi:hypothetical protein
VSGILANFLSLPNGIQDAGLEMSSRFAEIDAALERRARRAAIPSLRLCPESSEG